MTRRRPKELARQLVFDEAALLVALKSTDKLTRALAELVGRFGDDAVVDAAVKMQAQLWTPIKLQRAPAGRPPRWAAGRKIYAWLVVEAQWRAGRARDPKLALLASLKQRFRHLHGRPWRVVTDACHGAHLELPGVESARRYYREGVNLLREMAPPRRAMWNERAAKMARNLILSGGKKSARKRG